MNPLKHVAIIMDGNGRWGLKKKNNKKLQVIKLDLKTVEKIIKESIKQKIKFLNIICFFYRKLEKTKKRSQLFIQFIRKLFNK